jgi:hypothetical protein
VRKGRNLGRFGSVRLTFDGGYRLRLRVRTPDSDLIFAMWQRYRDSAHGEGTDIHTKPAE